MARDIVAKVYDGASPTTLLATLTTDSDRAWRHQYNDVGSGALTIHADDANASLLMGGNIVRFELNGTVRFAIVLQRPSRKTVAENEAQRLLQARGLGVLALMDRDVLLPENGVGRRSPSHRLFGFMSKYYDVGVEMWPFAVDVGAHSHPQGWADDKISLALWIWGQPEVVGPPPQPVGDNYFVRDYTLADAGDYVAFVTADDGYELYVDAALEAQATREFFWRNFDRVPMTLDAGPHRFAIRGINSERPGNEATNIAGVHFSLWSTTDGGQLDTEILVSDEDWYARAYPVHPPAVTPYLIMREAVAEVQALGATHLPGISVGADNSVDSNGNPWTIHLDIGWPVGTSLLAVLRTLVEQGVDVEMDPATLELKLYNGGTLGTDYTSGPGTISLTEGVNFGEEGEGHDGEDALANSALVQHHTGEWALLEDVSSAVVHGSRVVLLTAGTAPSADAADRTAEAVFRDYAEPHDMVRAQVERRGNGEDPYDDWEPGDSVLAPGMTDAPTDTLILALTVSEDDNGKAIFRFEGSQGDEGGS